jgi:hypothetical protein
MLIFVSICLLEKQDGPIFNVMYKKNSLRVNFSSKITDFKSIVATSAEYFGLPKD